MSINLNRVQGLYKQNESIYSSLSARSITIDFNISVIDITDLKLKTDDELSEIQNNLILENSKLKEISNKNKPPQDKKDKKDKQSEKTEKTEKTEQSKQSKQSEKTEQSKQSEQSEQTEQTDNFEDPIKKFSTIINMEDAKRAFFNKEYELFELIIKEQGLKMYRVNYKYASDKDGVPEFSAKNLIGGCVRLFDDYRKYFMICFRCFKDVNTITYTYPSLWILNSNDPIETIIDSLYDDYEFTQITDSELDKEKFLFDMRKINDVSVDNTNTTNTTTETDLDINLLIEEKYVH
jgi:hypothetical protein